ncbi:signal transduction histidine kinase/ActR/RegA family two-component response regulator [Variovorax sp. W1I1]|uniref:ATP-binding protein n=1 Tax=Variovorax sp. W1I1 TaxID=3042309 RepID=UPI00278598A6|nr:ATP-binding protein [Variovorax sp. W1I1]MDQ0608119.1 signal transduction histidine kinase/ActR/RegA family two-component response regulator [Variovorax sp. W1I1]
MRAPNLSARLLLVASAALIPLAVVCGLALDGLLRTQREQIQTTTLGVARALATAVDGELRLTVAALEALALTEPLGASEQTGLVDAMLLAKALRNSHADWRGVLLLGPDGKVLFSTEGNVNGPASEAVEPESLAAVVRTRKPAVGLMAKGPNGNQAFPVRVPVIRDDAVRYVLTAVVRPEAIGEVLARQSIPEGWTVSIFDAGNSRVARSREDERFRGMPPTESLLQMLRLMEARSEYVGVSRNVDGILMQTAVAKLEFAPWTAVLGAPQAVADDALWRTVNVYGFGLFVSLLVGGLASWWMSRSITRPIARLQQSADALGLGKPVTAHASGITEVDAVATALVSSAEHRAQHELERETLLAAERKALTTAQAAQERLERLAGASAVLSRSLEEASTLEAIAAIVVPAVGDLCRIDLLNENGVLERKLTHHLDPARSAQIAGMVSTRTASPDAQGSFPWAIATGQTFLRNLDDPNALQDLDPQLREFVQALGITAGCVVPLVARGRTIGAMAVLQDTSKRRFSPSDGALIGELAQRAALALDNVRLLAQARSAQNRAEVASRAKDEFLAMLGHELRNPLAPISLALSLIERKDDKAFPRERQIIERQVRHLSRLVDDLLDISRIVSGKIVLRPEPLDLRDIVAKAIELTLPALQMKAQMPSISLPAEPVPVTGDPLRLAQIVCNLLNNAAKFTSPTQRISLTLRATAGEAELAVADEGVGIAPELLPHVFERFVQAEQQLQRAAGGLGLGLAIARSLTELHGGTIEASSAGLERGSTFTVRLPLAAGSTRVDADAPSCEPFTRSLRLLLVDDNADALESLAEWFVLEGHQVLTAGSAEDALALLKTESVDGGIFDLGLPGMSGYELARLIRADDRVGRIALLALSGYGQQSDRNKALESGFDGHFSKPAHLSTLLTTLQRLIGPAPVDPTTDPRTSRNVV